MEDHENNPFKSQYSFASSILIPREVQMLDNCSTDVRSAAQACVKAVVECFEARKNTYLTQLKKIRETSNLATRNAIQHERSEAAGYINRLKEGFESQRRKESQESIERTEALQDVVAEMRLAADLAQAEITRLTQLEQSRQALQQAAVNEALERCREETHRERLQHQETAATEHRRLQTEAQSIVDEVKAQSEVN